MSSVTYGFFCYFLMFLIKQIICWVNAAFLSFSCLPEPRTPPPTPQFHSHTLLAMQGGQVGDFIAQIKTLGDILDIWAIKFSLLKMPRKPKFRVLGDFFPSAYVVKYVLGRYETSSRRYLGLVDLATLGRKGKSFLVAYLSTCRQDTVNK